MDRLEVQKQGHRLLSQAASLRASDLETLPHRQASHSDTARNTILSDIEGIIPSGGFFWDAWAFARRSSWR
jgi:hypothetical protein